MANDSKQYVTQAIDLPCSLASLQSLNNSSYPFLLESTAKADTLGSDSAEMHAHYDVLFAFPQGEISIDSNKNISSNNYKIVNDSFADTFHNAWRDENIEIDRNDTLGSFLGWFVYFSYEYAEVTEPTLVLPTHKNQLLARATRIPLVLVKDKAENKTYLVYESTCTNLVDNLFEDLNKCRDEKALSPNLMINEQEPDEYLKGVSKIKKLIYDGDVFQVNYSRLWQTISGESTDKISAHAVYENLRRSNPAPFSGNIHYPEFDILSSSPERLVKVTGNKVVTRPIAGTRPRDTNDASMLKELIEHPKERAEHIMLIDLERNDLGRVCDTGSIKVTELMVLESYAHVHHIVSNIEGQIKSGVKPLDIINAVFPGGTITGCPKVRCMEIIAEIEKTPREAYTGSVGYISHNGNMDLNILIRTMMLKNNTIYIRAGAGIVYDSLPEKELEETRAKAKGLLLGISG